MSKNYLTDFSANDKPWDKHHRDADQVSLIYQAGDLPKYSDRINRCAPMLFFGSRLDDQGRKTIKLKSAFFCRVRTCPVCQWRRSLMWKARIGQALPLIERAYPKARWIHLTLTIRNCPITDLRENLVLMNKAYQRLTQVQKFPAIGTFKSLEVTRGEDGSAHPHFHILLLVKPSYFQGTQYISQKNWIEMWRKALRVDYDPGAYVQKIKSLDDDIRRFDIVAEVAKYTVKGDDLIKDAQWTLEYTKQVHKMRAISIGGVLKEYLSEADATNEELVIGEAENPIEELIEPFYMANWDKPDSRYTIREIDD